MRKVLVAPAVLIVCMALFARPCLANGQASTDETGFVATSTADERDGSSTGRPQELAMAEGGADAGGGNSVGTELFDDYENKDSALIPKEKLRELVRPYLADLRTKVPALADELERGISAKKWYLEPKPLSQTGACLNQSVVSVKLVVRACQSAIAVRIDQDFFEKNPEFQAPLVLHELLVNLQLKKNSRSFAKVTDEMVRDMSRTLRDPAASAEQIVAAAKQNGFDQYMTARERNEFVVLERELKRAYCRHDYKAFDVVTKKLDKWERSFGGRGNHERLELSDKIDVLKCGPTR